MTITLVHSRISSLMNFSVLACHNFHYHFLVVRVVSILGSTIDTGHLGVVAVVPVGMLDSSNENPDDDLDDDCCCYDS